MVQFNQFCSSAAVLLPIFFVNLGEKFRIFSKYFRVFQIVKNLSLEREPKFEGGQVKLTLKTSNGCFVVCRSRPLAYKKLPIGTFLLFALKHCFSYFPRYGIIFYTHSIVLVLKMELKIKNLAWYCMVSFGPQFSQDVQYRQLRSSAHWSQSEVYLDPLGPAESMYVDQYVDQFNCKQPS